MVRNILTKVFNTTVSVKEGASRSVLRGIIQHDTLNEVNIRLSDGSKAFDYTGYSNIIFKVLKADGTPYIDSNGSNVIATSPADGIVTVILKGQATAAAGLCQSVIEIYSNGGKMTTARLNYEVFAALEVDEDAIVSEPEYAVLQNMISEVSALSVAIDAAEAARAEAEMTRETNEARRIARNDEEAVYTSWSSTKAFKAGNKAVYNGSTFRCLKDCTGIDTSDTEYWIMIAQRGGEGKAGNNGVILSVDGGIYGFEIDERGHLILVYEDGDTPPDMELGDDGHLYINLG